MDTRPLHDEADYERALSEVDALMGRDISDNEAVRLELLVTLVEAYESKAWPVDLPDPVSAIEFVMEQRSLGRDDIAPLLGSRTIADDVLQRRRALTLDMIRSLHERLGIPADLLIRDYALTKPAA